MTEAVTSKFSNIYLAKGVLLSLYLVISTIVCIRRCISHYSTYNWGQLAMIGAYSLLLVVIYAYLVLNTLRRITATSQGLVIRYLITKKEITVDYADIEHVASYVVNGNDAFNIIPNSLKLVIELSTGENISFTDDQFSNYYELKEAIRRFRFHLN